MVELPPVCFRPHFPLAEWREPAGVEVDSRSLELGLAEFAPLEFRLVRRTH